MAWRSCDTVDEVLLAMDQHQEQVAIACGVNIGDAGACRIAAALAANTTLRRLSLRGNAVGDTGAAALAKALKSNDTLRDLYLHNNIIGDKGVQELAEALKMNYSLCLLNLDGNRISNLGARALEEALPCNSSLTKLHLDRNAGISQVLKQQIAALFQVKKDDPKRFEREVAAAKERCIILQLTTMPSESSDIQEDNGLDVVVTKMTGQQVLSQPLQPETTLREVAVKVAVLCEFPPGNLRWVLSGPRTVGVESFDEPLLQLLQGGPGPAEH